MVTLEMSNYKAVVVWYVQVLRSVGCIWYVNVRQCSCWGFHIIMVCASWVCVCVTKMKYLKSTLYYMGPNYLSIHHTWNVLTTKVVWVSIIITRYTHKYIASDGRGRHMWLCWCYDALLLITYYIWMFYYDMFITSNSQLARGIARCVD